MDWPIPILLVGDAPDQSSGLARVVRDLASILVGQPEWRVGTLGWLGHGSSRLPWQQYQMAYGEWGEHSLPAVWEDFAKGQPGVIFTVWDLHRILWLARPEYVEDPAMRTAIEKVRATAKLWAYTTFDATGPGDKLTVMAREALLGCDRLLAYTPWHQEVIERTIGREAAIARGLTWMPHGLGETWQP